MKFDLIIKDANIEEILRLASLLNDNVSLGASGKETIHTSNGYEIEIENSISSETDNDSSDQSADANSLDKDGLPWDARIHSKEPTLTGKGVWRAKRGVDKELVAQVEAELRAKQTVQPSTTPVAFAGAPAGSGAALPVQPYVPPVPVQLPTTQPAPLPVPPAPQPEPVAVVQPAPLPVPPAPQPEEEITFEGFLQRFQNLHASGVVDQNYLVYLAQRCGVSAVTDLAYRPDLIKYAVSVMKHEGKW